MLNKSISVSEQVNELSDFAALLFTWLIPHTDDYGVIPGSSRKIRALVVPMRKQTDKQVEDALNEIQRAGLIWRYEYCKNEYLQFCKFDEHQEGLHKRTAPKNPIFKEVNGDLDNFREIPGNSPLIEPNRTEPKGTELKGTEKKEAGKQKTVFDFSFYTENEELLEALNGFYAMRKAIKKPMTDNAARLMCKKLDKLSTSDDEKIAILNKSTMSSWTDIYALNENDRLGGGANRAHRQCAGQNAPEVISQEAGAFSEYRGIDNIPEKYKNRSREN